MTEINQNKKKRYFPSSFLIIIGLMFLFIAASWIGKAIDSDKIIGIGILDVFTSIWRGFLGKAEVILFIFSIGGTLGIMTKIKAIDAGISALVNKLGDKVWLLIPVLMLIFGLGGATYGMWEETIAFIPILIPVFKKAKYGSFTAILVILIGSGVGCLASTINPFAIGSAISAINTNSLTKDAIQMTTGSLQGTRWISLALFEMIAIPLVCWMASRYRKGIINNWTTDGEARANDYSKKMAQANDSSKNMVTSCFIKAKNMFISFFIRARVVEGIDHKLIKERFKEQENVKFTLRKKISLALFIMSFVLMIIMYLPWKQIISSSNLGTSVSNYNKSMFWFASTSGASGFAMIGDWYFISVAAIFLLATIIIFALNFKEFKSSDENAEQGFINSYISGIKDVVSVCLLIGVAAGLGNILEATKYGILIAQESAKGLNNLIVFGVVVFIVSILLSLLVPSTSGFAAAFVPIFAAIAIKAFPDNKETAIGIAILGFIFANGLANFVTPTSAALMGYTQYAGVPYYVWIKQTWKIVVVFFMLSLLLIIGFSGIAASGYSLF